MDAVRALALAGLLLACATPAGAGLLRLVGLEEKRTTGRAERWLLSATAGLGLLATAYTVIGLAGLFTPPLVLLLPPALVLALLLPGRGFLRRTRSGRPPAQGGKRFPNLGHAGHHGSAGGAGPGGAGAGPGSTHRL